MAFYEHCQTEKCPFPLEDIHDFGFEFSIEDILRAISTKNGRCCSWPTIKAHYNFELLCEEHDAA